MQTLNSRVSSCYSSWSPDPGKQHLFCSRVSIQKTQGRLFQGKPNLGTQPRSGQLYYSSRGPYCPKTNNQSGEWWWNKTPDCLTEVLYLGLFINTIIICRGRQTSNGMCCAELQIYKAKPNTRFNLNKSIYSIFKSDKTHTEMVLNSHCIKFFSSCLLIRHQWKQRMTKSYRIKLLRIWRYKSTRF